MHLVLTGATGAVGSAVLNHLLHHAGKTTKVTILSRNVTIPLLKEPHELNVEVIKHSDFRSYSSVMPSLHDADALIWALGISQSQVSAEDYVAITKDYPLAAAQAFGSNGRPFNFVYVSGEGATTTPGRFSPIFARVKGETEQALLNITAELPDLRVYSARPGGVDSAHDPEVHEVAKGKRVGTRRLEPVLMPLFRTFYASMVSPTKELGKVLVQLAESDGKQLDGDGISGDGRTVSNVALRRMAGL